MGSLGCKNRTSFPWMALWTHHSGPGFLAGICTYPNGAWGTLPPVPSQGHHPPAVVTELEDIVGVGGCLGAHDGLKQRVWELLSIHVKSTLEEPVSAVLAAGTMWGGESRVETWVMSQALPPFLLTSIKGRITVRGQSTFQKVISFQWSVIVDYTDPE